MKTTHNEVKVLAASLEAIKTLGETILQGEKVSLEDYQDFRNLTRTVLSGTGLPMRRTSLEAVDEEEIEDVDLDEEVEAVEEEGEEIDLEVPDAEFLDDDEDETDAAVEGETEQVEGEETDGGEETAEEEETAESTDEEAVEDAPEEETADDIAETTEGDTTADDTNVDIPDVDDASGDDTGTSDGDDTTEETETEEESEETQEEQVEEQIEEQKDDEEEQRRQAEALVEDADKAEAAEEEAIRNEMIADLQRVSVITKKVTDFIIQTDDSGLSTDNVRQMAEMQESNESFKAYRVLDRQLAKVSNESMVALRHRLHRSFYRTSTFAK